MSHNDRFALETPALTGGVVMEGHARFCRENGHAFNRKDGVEQGWCPRCGESNGLAAELVTNVEIWIDDAVTDEAADLTPDKAAYVLASAGVVFASPTGLLRKTAFDGCYHVDVARTWWDAMVASGDDLDVEVHPGLHVHLALV